MPTGFVRIAVHPIVPRVVGVAVFRRPPTGTAALVAGMRNLQGVFHCDDWRSAPQLIASLEVDSEVDSVTCTDPSVSLELLERVSRRGTKPYEPARYDDAPKADEGPAVYGAQPGGE